MKNKFLLTATLISAVSAGLFAGEYEDYLKEAENVSVEKRIDLWLKASEATKDEAKKLALYRQAYETAKKIDDSKGTLLLADLIYRSKNATPEEKLEDRFTFLCIARTSAKKVLNYEGRTSQLRIAMDGVSVQDYVDFMKESGLTPEQQKRIAIILAGVYHDYDLWYKEIELRKQILERQDLTAIEKQDQYLILSNLYLAMNNMEDSVKNLEKLLEMKSLTPQRRVRTLIILGDTLRKGYGWYYRPNAEQFKKMNESYKAAMELAAKRRLGTYYNQALFRMIEGAHSLNNSKEVVKLCQQYIQLGNKRVDGKTYKDAKILEGKHHLALRNYPEAIEIFEQLYKWKHDLANTCMSLGESYYQNDDFSMALGMYDEAIVELGMDDSARPRQCKNWGNILRGLLSAKPTLDAAYLARSKRLNAEAKAAGKGAVVKERASDSLNPFANQKVKKKKPKTMDDLMKAQEEETNLLEGGLF
ncbi:MAG: hypothetical protein J6Q65_05750 [Lentisphaeria bacterium]|nr:hypothetical protein [Lentisphaeria bacterium]